MDLYTPLLFAWARRCGEREEDAADLVQETFVTLMQTIPSFEHNRKGSFRRWLRVLMVNKLRDRLRRQSRYQQVLAELPAEVEVPNVAEQFWEQEYQQELSHQALRLIQAEFEPRTWKACWETVVQGRSVAEVAAELGVSHNAVYVAKCRVLRRLRECLDGLLD